MKISLFFWSFLITVSAFGQIAERAEDVSPLLIGEAIPAIQLKSIDNKEISTQELFMEKPSVLLFYRGGWCPYCNAHLAAVGEISEKITALGYQIIAISPDSPEKLGHSIEKQDLDYQLFSDAGGDLTSAMGLAFKSPEKYGAMLSEYSGGGNAGFLPVPALFIVDKQGSILFEYISPDYKNRIEAPLLLSVLQHYQLTE
jgi:peroxiredoxin